MTIRLAAAVALLMPLAAACGSSPAEKRPAGPAEQMARASAAQQGCPDGEGDAEENAVWSATVDSAGGGNRTVVLDRTVPPGSTDVLSGDAPGNAPVAADIAADLKAREGRIACVGSRLVTRAPHDLLPDAEVQAMFQNHPLEQGWKAFHDRFPGASHIVSVSRVGFDGARTRALVWVTTSCGSLCGEGGFFVLEKKAGAWTVTGKRIIWTA